MIAEYLNRLQQRIPSPNEIRRCTPADEFEIYSCDILPLPDVWSPDCPLSGPDDRFEALLCLSGEMRLTQADGHSLTVKQGEVLLASPSAAALPEISLTDRRFRCMAVSVSPQAFLRLRAQLTSLFPGSLDFPRLRAMLSRKNGLMLLHDDVWSASVQASLAQLTELQSISCFLLRLPELLYLAESRAASSGDPGSRTPSRRYFDPFQAEQVRAAHDYMLSHLEEKLTIQELSARFRLSPTAFKSCFRQLYGEPVHSCLLRCRLEQAAHLLRTSSDSILSVALTVGYSGASRFSVAFREKYHMSPVQYRRQYGSVSSAKNV